MKTRKAVKVEFTEYYENKEWLTKSFWGLPHYIVLLNNDSKLSFE